jgi:hypothetical protein
MSLPEPPSRQEPRAFDEANDRLGLHYGYGRYMALLALLLLGLVVLNTVLSGGTHGARGIAPGRPLPPFAVPLATGDLNGYANVATRANEGTAGRLPACSVRGPQVLNVCQLYEAGPVVLALFVNGGSCAAILTDLQKIAPAFPGVRFAGVAIGGDRAALRRLIGRRRLSLPIGIDRDGAVAAVYQDASCPQVTFAYPGGLVQSRALLTRPSRSTLSARVSALVAAARARGWKGPAG